MQEGYGSIQSGIYSVNVSKHIAKLIVSYNGHSFKVKIKNLFINRNWLSDY